MVSLDNVDLLFGNGSPYDIHLHSSMECRRELPTSFAT